MSFQADNATSGVDGNDNLSLDDLNAIMSLQRQEAFDETLEEVHAQLSKRDTIRRRWGSDSKTNSNSTNGPPVSSPNNGIVNNGNNNSNDNENNNAESMLLQIITSQATSQPSQQSSASRRKSIDGSLFTATTKQQQQQNRGQEQQQHRFSAPSLSHLVKAVKGGADFANRVRRGRREENTNNDTSSMRQSSIQDRINSSTSGGRRSKSVSKEIDAMSLRKQGPPSSRGRIARTNSASSRDTLTSTRSRFVQEERRRRSTSRHVGSPSSSSRKRSSSQKATRRPSRHEGDTSSRADRKDDNRPAIKRPSIDDRAKIVDDVVGMMDLKSPGKDPSSDRGENSSYSSSRSNSLNSKNAMSPPVQAPRGFVRSSLSAARAARKQQQQQQQDCRQPTSQGQRNAGGSPSVDLEKHGNSNFDKRSSRKTRLDGDVRASPGSARLYRRSGMFKQTSSQNFSEDGDAATGRGRNNKESGGRRRNSARSAEPRLDVPIGDRRTEKSRSAVAEVGDDSSVDEFDLLWKDDLTPDTDQHGGNSSNTTLDERSVAAGSVNRKSGASAKVEPTSPTGEKIKKTKLEKIHELQAKCDRYKKEWIDACNDKRRFRRDLETAKVEAMSLSKQVETHITETTILQKNLSEALLKLDQTQEEQRKERTDHSNTAKDLAQARIDHAKSVNECREGRSQLDHLAHQLADRDREISALKAELQTSKETVENLEADIAYADEQIEKLEQDIKTIQEEVHMYRQAADKSDTSGEDGNAENLRVVRDEMEKRLHEERENRLDEKQRKLDERMKQFEEEKERYLEIQQAKEREYLERTEREVEKSRAREVDRQKLDDEINDRLKMLENDNAALHGRLKSEQLNSTTKMKLKDEIIEKLQKELIELQKNMQQQNGDPSSLASMQDVVESMKTEVSNTKMDLEEAYKQNGMMQEEVDDLRTVNSEMKTWVVTLQDNLKEQNKEIDSLKRKADEYHKKSGEWSSKAFEWKEKADHWEKTARSLNPDGKADPGNEPGHADPQALFLAAAVEKKKAVHPPHNASSWLGGIFHKTSDVEDDVQIRVDELEVENAKQSVEIKHLKSEMVKMQSMYKGIGYSNQQVIEQLQKENEAVELKCSNLLKELELARKLNQSMVENGNE